MRVPRRLANVVRVAVAVLAAACVQPDGETERSAVDDSAPNDGAGSIVVEDEMDEAVPACLRGGPFVAGGTAEMPDAEPGDADRVSGLRWHRYEGCERFVLDLVDADGEAATRPGVVRAELIRELGVVRIALRDVQWVDPAATDATFEGPLARAAYVVSSPEGRWVYVDIHLGDPAEAFVTTLEEPARVVVDLRPAGGTVPAAVRRPASAETRVVVLEPRPGSAAYPLTITGYARTFEANVVVRLEHDGETVHDDFTTATAWVDAWGHYSLTIPDGPTGRVVLHVGEHSARDGSWEGVAVPLDMR